MGSFFGRFFPLCFVCLSLLAACGKVRPNDPLDEGFQKIDREDYAGAIEFFEELQSRDPNSRVKIALASAYAGRAGVVINRFWVTAQLFRGPELTPEYLETHDFYLHNQKNLEPIAPVLSEETKLDIRDFLLSMTSLEIYRQRLDTYPYVKADRRGDLVKAVQVLAGDEDPGARLYRVLINAVVVRSELDDGFDVWNSVENQFAELLAYPLEYHRIVCKPVTGDLTQWMSLQFSRSLEITQDLSVAYPSQKTEFQSLSAPVNSYQTRLAELQSKLVPQGCP